MKQHILIPFLFLLLHATHLDAQIINGQDTLYGNEWIHFDQTYFKIMVADDGIYRINFQTLQAANLPMTQVEGNRFQIFHNGEEIPIYLTTDGLLSDVDFIEFYGQKNTSELDRYLFKDPDHEMMNPRYSLFTDTAAYFLTWNDLSTNLRYQSVANDLTNLPPKEEYFPAEYFLNYFSAFSKKADANGISSSDYGITEGYSNAFANTQTIAIAAPNPYLGGPNASLYLRYGTNIGQHQQQISLNGQPLQTDELSDYQVVQRNFPVENSLLSAALSLKLLGLASSNDKQRISNILLRYPGVFNFNNQPSFAFQLTGSSSPRYLEISNFKLDGGQPVLYDLDHHQRILGTVENNLVKLKMAPVADTTHYVLSNDASGIYTINSLLPIHFIDYASLNAEYILLSNPKLYDDGNGNNWVQEYANYRASAAGGGFQTVIVNVQQLYDQFAWGVNRHPFSVKNFGHYIKKHWPDVKDFFIIGKGREYNAIRTSAQLANANNASFYVPTYGYPGSDNLLLSNFKHASPIIPMGRIPVSTPDDINIFLEKMKGQEGNITNPQTIEDRLWMKNIIHLGGGGTASEQSIIKSYLANMENIIENNQFGGNVTSFYKVSTDPIQVSKSEQIFDRINKGTSIITFFGHSAVGTFDFNIDNPDNYENKNNYPLMFSLGCYVGNIHTSGLGISERFVFQKEKAAIGMVATTGEGYISTLNNFMSKFYELLGNELYGKSTGELLKGTISVFDSLYFGQPELLQQITYNGDPAYRIPSAPGPDFTVDASSVQIEPKIVNTGQDSFLLSFDVVNIGENVNDSIRIDIEQEFPSGDKIQAASLTIPAPAYFTQINLKLPSIGKPAVGLNKLNITVDASNKVDELPTPVAEMNNDLTTSPQGRFQFFVIDNSATPVYPADFGIVGDDHPVLRACTSDPLSPIQGYRIEIDTTRMFNSPLKASVTKQQIGGLIEWTPPIPFVDERVYYWRISPDSLTSSLGYAWDDRSFTYIKGSMGGWSQRHYYQFLEDQMEDVKLDNINRDFSFLEDYKDFRIKNKVYNSSDPPNGYVNGARWSDFFRWDVQGSITVVVFDTLGRIQFNFNPGQYGSVNTSAPRIGAFPFPLDNLSKRSSLISFIDSIIPDNYWVFVYTSQRNLTNTLNISDWEADSTQLNGKNLFNILELQGATHIRSLKDNLVPYLVAFRKNHGLIGEKWADSPQSEFNYEISIPGYWYDGRVLSKYAGPAAKWDSFSWKVDTLGQIQQDTFYTNIYGVSKDLKTEHLFFEKFMGNETSLSNISADSFPYIRLEFYAKDSIERSPVQLKDWTISYQGLPDAAINSASGFVFYSDTLQEGKPLQISYFVSPTVWLPMDSLLISYKIKGEDGSELEHTQRVGPLPPDDGFLVNFEEPTKGLKGNRQLVVQLNPGNDQPELYDFNNYLAKGFHVTTDTRNPLLDVTFDGAHILDGDIVAPAPVILVSLKDENLYLLLDDTSTYKLFLSKPDGSLERIAMNSPEIQFMPATNASNNKSSLIWHPRFEMDGAYALIVQASDMTGNDAGNFDYKITFKVVLESMLSNLLPYPNPFSTATRFVYTLTGAVPTFFKIQIMTIAGQIVREITQDEIGTLRIGTHQTEYAWDGTDEFGDKLANGIYLYRVIAKDGKSDNFQKFETNTDSFFKKGFGKIVILR